MLSSTNTANILQGITKAVSPHSSGGKRRNESFRTSLELLEKTLKSLKKLRVKASHILLDSWFATPATLESLTQHFSVICKAKKTTKIHYVKEFGVLCLSDIFKKVKKRPGRAKWLSSICVHTKNKFELRIIFVRHQSKKKEWVALLTTDLHTSEEEIISLLQKSLFA